MSSEPFTQYGVLIVEDDRTTRHILAQTLQDCGYTVKQTGLASEALSLIDSSVHLAIIDIGLPDFDGQNLATRIRRRFKKERLPICFISSQRSPDCVRTSIASGGDDHIVKPIDKVILLNKLTKLLGQRNPRFAWISADCPAELVSSDVLPIMKLVRVSETGLVLMSSAGFKEGAFIEVESAALSAALEFPLSKFVQRVTACERVRNRFAVRSEFVGLSDEQYQSIRRVTVRGIALGDLGSQDEQASVAIA